ncbi:MAG: TonB-dependent receptor [Phycisphaerae bacterium]|nr:TonB-dependent receptor [Phycisphaerae bacterium]
MSDHRSSRLGRCAYLGVLLTVCLLAGVRSASAESPKKVTEAPVADDDAVSTGDELLLFEYDDMTTVVSATRRPEKVKWLSMPVGVISSRDIHYGGLTNIPDILEFATGVDVLRINRNRVVVGIRGMHELYSDRLKTLIDGRSADNIMTGGANLLRLPVPIEDIARIEVVRGPAGGVWGANAFTGVINIITKDPEDCLGLFMSSTVNQFGESYSHVRHGGKEGKFGWLASLVYNRFESSEDAIAGDHFISNDFSRSYRFNGKGIYDIEEDSKLSFGLAYMHMTFGEGPTMGNTSTKTADMVRTYARIDRTKGDVTGYLQWYNNFEHNDETPALRYTAMENVLEGQLDFHLSDKHTTSVGGSASWMFMDQRNSDKPGYVNGIGQNQSEFLAGAFIMDRYKATDRLEFEAQLRGDFYSETHTDWSGRLSAIYALDQAKQHVARVSAAKAFRTPFTVLRKTSQQYALVAAGAMGPNPDLYMSQILAPLEDLKNEETWALEAGYTGQINKELSVQGNLYYQRFSKLIGFYGLGNPLGFGQSIVRPKNLNGADSYGAEAEAKYKTDKWMFKGWYAYNDFVTDDTRQDVRSYMPATHKMGLTGRLFLPQDWALSGNYRYKTSTSADHLTAVTDGPSSHRFDVGVSKAFGKGNGEVMFGVSDLFHRNVRGVRGIDVSGGHDTPGRTFFIRLQWKF